MRQLRPARGEGNLGCIVWLVLMIALAVVLWEGRAGEDP